MTIKKSQGQTFDCEGIDLRCDCFSHGQSSMGHSRTGKSKNKFVLIPNEKSVTKKC